MKDVTSLNKMVEEALEQISRQTESSLLSQLKWFVDRGILIIQTTRPILTKEPTKEGFEFKVSQSVELVLKDKEYIESLEEEINVLKKTVNCLIKDIK